MCAGERSLTNLIMICLNLTIIPTAACIYAGGSLFVASGNDNFANKSIYDKRIGYLNYANPPSFPLNIKYDDAVPEQYIECCLCA
ncbi:hypothetical protein F5Y04DRAFT_47664 [Hypomontagnella monticulosa]|nr:hypothetical protein F5Y04DRAFT_47664 [Hypomontagnella monticulosa]